jgi:glycosyltransferase involved in cell wall biosynthesis
MKNYKIVAIVQIYNELEKGNLKRFFNYISPCVDAVVAYDDCSTDGSYEYALKHAQKVIRGTKNNFSLEIQHKQQLLEVALSLNPDFILSIDADEVLSSGGRVELRKLCAQCELDEIDGYEFHLINLWRSSSWKRVDSLYNDGWFVKLWRVSGDMHFDLSRAGLHQKLHPPCIKKVEKQNVLQILHYGFADITNQAYKYLTYRSHGQRGYIMLDRLISEDSLMLEEVPESLYPPELYQKDQMPYKRSFVEALGDVEKLKPRVNRPKYSIACLIYKSTEWLEFVYGQVLKFTDLSDIEFYFVTNDADKHVIDYLINNHIPHYVYKNSDSQRSEWYINNVYRAYNYAASVAKGDFVVLINSDMCFSEGWFDALVAGYDGRNVVSSRLVESGKLKTGLYGIEKNFGTDVTSYKEADFLHFAKSISKNQIAEGGLYMPLFFRREHFTEVGGYPEGNLKIDVDIFSDDVALQGEKYISGDAVLMKRLETIGVRHVTAMNSIVYHFQCGEKDSDEYEFSKVPPKNIAICNDICGGLMGEKVLWSYLLEGIPATYALDTTILGRASFENRARATIDKDFPDTKLVIQNATFIDRIHPQIYTICFLQDDLRKMGKSSVQQEINLKYADRLVTNSVQTSLSYPEYEFEIIPVGIDSELFHPADKNLLKQKHGLITEKVGIFVGSLSEVKGWSKVKGCIDHFKNMTWIVVSKYDERYEAPNVKMYSRIDQILLAELLNCADVFVIGSPVETQCLAAVEANLCNVPVAMPLVGIYKDFNKAELRFVGVFNDDLIEATTGVLVGTFNPREVIIEKGLTLENNLRKWRQLVENSYSEASQQLINGSKQIVPASYMENVHILIAYGLRNFLINFVLGDRYWLIASIFTLRGAKHAIRELLIHLHLLKPAKNTIKKIKEITRIVRNG